MLRKNSKNRLYIFLMYTSMLLLVVLQFFWLKQNYQQQKADLEKEIAIQFKNTIFERQDSLINRMILEPLTQNLPDSINTVDIIPRLRRLRPKENHPISFFSRKDSFSLPKQKDLRDSIQFNVVHPQRNKSEEEFFRKRLIRSLAYTLRGMNDPSSISWIDFGEDSIRITKIRSTLEDKLEVAGIEIPFEVLKANREDTLQLLADGIYSPVMLGGVPFRNQYVAHFSEYRDHIIKSMLPLILFSTFLTLITGLSFYLVYRSLKRQQRLTTVKNAFISNVSHELQTPITSVGVALEALSSFDVLENRNRTEEYLEISKSELSRLSILVDKVLKMAIVEEDNLRLHKERIDIKALVEKVLRSMQVRFDQFNAEIIFETKGKSFDISADKIHLTSVVYNILDNALKYSKGQPKIKVILTSDHKGVEISVNDQGIGIPLAYRDKIFEKFFRVPNGDLHSVKGHGLGLSYVASIIQKHNAQIEVNSQPGIGSTFNLAFPK